MTDPIKPAEVQVQRAALIPDKVIECFNEMIVRNSHENRIGTTVTAKVLQKDVVALIVERMNLDSSDQIFKEHWLDVEKLYEEAGWHVVYDKPVSWAGENYDAYYKFEWSKY